MSDTPETDAAWDKYINPYTYSAGDVRILAERLERERDEWAAMCGRYKQERDIAEADATNFHARIFELINERDEARKETNNHYVNYLGARYMANELADIASKYLSFLLAATPIKANETHEKETMKVIDALKRWKEL